MPCPWYQYGLCTSPKLPEPTESVVAVDRCNSEDLYINCVYYVEEMSRGVSKRTSIRKEKAKIYVPIHAIPSRIECSCPECEVGETDNGIKVAYCKVLDRYLTRYDLYICSRHWRNCPYRTLSYPST